MLTEDDRATPMGFFQFGEAYFDCANALRTELPLHGHRSSAVKFMYFHAIELYLKAFLRLKGVPIAQLSSKQYGHDLSKLSTAAEDRGLTIELYTSEALEEFTDFKYQIESRYFRSRSGPQLNVEALWVITKRIRRSVAHHFGLR